MARAKNMEMREKIYRMAICIFADKGYTATTFAAIAKACDVEKTVIQYYYPYKELFIKEFLAECSAQLDELSNHLVRERFDPYGELYYMSYVFYEFLLSSPRMKNLTMDIISNRSLSDLIIPPFCSRDRRYSGDRFDERATILSVGGAMELIYYRLSNGIPVTALEVTTQGYYVFAAIYGFSLSEEAEKIRQYRITREEILEDVRDMEEHLFPL